MKKTLLKSLALAAVGSLFVVGSAMALPSDYFTATDFTTGTNGTMGFNLVDNTGSANFGIYWINDITNPNPSTIDTLGITFNNSTNYGQLNWVADGSLWDVRDLTGATTTQDKSNVFGFYFDDGTNKHYTDTSLSGNDVTVIALSGTAFQFAYGTNQAIVKVNASDIAPVPEPATMLLLGTGLAGIAGLRRKKTKKS